MWREQSDKMILLCQQDEIHQAKSDIVELGLARHGNLNTEVDMIRLCLFFQFLLN